MFCWEATLLQLALLSVIVICFQLLIGTPTTFKMVPCLDSCTKIEMPGVIKFFSAGVEPSEIHRRMIIVRGEGCFSQRRVHKWVEKFKNGVQDLEVALWHNFIFNLFNPFIHSP